MPKGMADASGSGLVQGMQLDCLVQPVQVRI